MVPLVFGIGLLCFTKSHVLFNMAIAINKGGCSPFFYTKNKGKCSSIFLNVDFIVYSGVPMIAIACDSMHLQACNGNHCIDRLCDASRVRVHIIDV